MQCKYCGKEYKNVILHEIRCKNNPNKLPPVSQLRKVTSNQYIKAKELGLPKPQLTQEAKEKCANSFKGKHHTEETKQKISNSYKKYLIEHPEKVPFKLNHSSKKSYPEQYFEELFINEGIPLKYHKQIGRYELDFYNEELKKYVEIDGEQHYTDKMIQHDKERNEYLLNLGWNGLRIRWSEYKKLSEKEKEDKIQEVKTFLFS